MKLFLDIHTKQVEKLNNPQISKHLASVKKQTDRLHKLVADLFDVSQIQKGKLQFSKEKFRIDLLLQDTVQELQLNIHSHTIQIKNLHPVIVYGDKFRIYQVITNLINNAVKYSPDGEKILVSLVAKKSEVTIKIKDFGMGIPKEQQEKIFDRFYQTSEAREKIYSGLGMGLYIAYEIVQNHGGKIWVESTPESISSNDTGSTFLFTLPLVLGD